jgi:diguanylate cyclase (GGDEF)-like protein
MKLFTDFERQHNKLFWVLTGLVLIVGVGGGDEFAFLFPETGATAAPSVIAKIQRGLLAEMQGGNWPITFSIGVVTCLDPPQTTDEIVKLADDLMYTVKHGGKNAISYATYGGEADARRRQS